MGDGASDEDTDGEDDDRGEATTTAGADGSTTAPADDGGDDSSSGGEPVPPPPANADFCEVDGRVVVEVEHFAGNDGYAQLDRADASGGAVMQVGDDGSLDLSVHFDSPGEVYVWIRTYVPSQDSENNGLFLDLDGEALVAPDGHPYAGVPDIYLKKVGWAWAPDRQGEGVHEGPVTFEAVPGDHILTIHKRKVERPELDKIVLEFDGVEPDDLGPDETPCP